MGGAAGGGTLTVDGWLIVTVQRTASAGEAPTKVWNKLSALGLTGQGPDDVLARGGYLQDTYSRGKRMLLAGQGMAETLKNQALGVVGAILV